MADLDARNVTDAVVEKYKTAAGIANAVMAALIGACTPGTKVVDICTHGDNLIVAETAKVYGKIKDKGLGFPTTLSINNVLGNFTPNQDHTQQIQLGDLVKIELGVQIDGFLAPIAHTIVVVADAKDTVTGRQADVICAAYYASQIVHRLLRPGVKASSLTEAIGKTAATFQCAGVSNVFSFELSQYDLYDDRLIPNAVDPSREQAEDFDIAPNRPYVVDIVISTGRGKVRERDEKATLYRRNQLASYSLSLDSARKLYSEVKARFPHFPFPARYLESPGWQLGMTECLKHNVIQQYPVYHEQNGEFVAQFKFLCITLPSSTNRLTDCTLLNALQSEFKLTDELNAYMALGVKRKRKNKKKKKAKKPTNMEID